MARILSTRARAAQRHPMMRIYAHIRVRKLTADGRPTAYKRLKIATLEFETFEQLLMGIITHTHYKPALIYINGSPFDMITRSNFETKLPWLQMRHQDPTASEYPLYLAVYYTDPEPA